MEFQFGAFRLELDVDRTRAFYEQTEPLSAVCSCSGCRNFEKAAALLPEEVLSFFRSIGADAQKPAEVYVNETKPDGLVWYGGFYHLCGRVLEGESAWVEVPAEGVSLSRWESVKTYPVSDRFRVSFQEKCALVEEGFPRPVIQMEIEADVPWVLQEPNTYP